MALCGKIQSIQHRSRAVACAGSARTGDHNVSNRLPARRPEAQGSLPSRRDTLLGAILLPLGLSVPAARAGPVGEAIAGLWKGRQQANKDLILAPIKVAQQRLGEAMRMMDNMPQGADQPMALEPVLQAVRVSSLNCYVFEALPGDSVETKASLYTQQWQLSDPCTFRLIVKNITGLSSDDERRHGEDLVANLILSYQKLDGELEGAIQGSTEAGEAARSQLRATVGYMNELETYVQSVLA